MTAAEMVVVVKATGITATSSQIKALHGELGKASTAAGKAGTDIETAGKRGTRSMGALKTGLAALGGVLVLDKAVQGIKYATKASSDLGEQINKNSVVFKGSEKEIITWSKSTAGSLGLSQRAALEATGTFGNMLVPMGFARDKAGEMSQGLVTLSADLASFNNKDPAQVLDALRAGLSGETEPLRQLGVSLNQARIEQEAMNKGLWDGKGQIDAAAKASATYSLILKDTKLAQGDFANTSDSLANRQRIVKAQLEDTAAIIGGVFVTAANAALGVVSTLITQIQTGVGVGGALRTIFESLGAAIGFVVGGFTGFIDALRRGDEGAVILATTLGTIVAGFTAMKIAGALTVALYAFAAAGGVAGIATTALGVAVGVLTSPITLVVAAVAGIIAVLVHLYKTNETVRKVIDTVWNAIKTAVSSVVKFLGSFIPQTWNAIKSVTSSVWTFIKTHIVGSVVSVYNRIRDTIGKVIEWLKGAWETIKGAVSTAWKAIGNAITGTFDDVYSGAKETIGDVIDWLDEAWGKIKSGVASAFRAIGRVISNIWEGIVSSIEGFVNSIIHAINFVIEATGGDPLAYIGKRGQNDGARSAGEGAARAFARGGAFGRTGGFVNSPMTFMGEEAPRHPEFVIPTNPAYRSRAQGLLAKAAGAIGLKGGGTFGGSVVEALGPYDIAPFSYDANHAGANSHWHIGTTTSDVAVAIGKQIQRMGFSVSEHPAFGGVGTHSSGSLHYSGRAIDANSAADETQAETRRIAEMLGGAVGALGSAGGAVGVDIKKALEKLPGVGQLPGFLQSAGELMRSKAKKYMEGLSAAGSAVGGAMGSMKGMKDVKGGGSPLAIGQQMAASVGWSGAQWTALKELWTRESGWNPTADNPTSDAYGIPQALPGSKMASAGSDWLTNPATQIKWGLGYIKDRYGSPSAALSFHDANNWYAKGGMFGAPFVGSYASGGVVPRDGMAQVHAGETITPAGGSLVHIEHAEFRNDADIQVLGRELGWRVARGF